MRITVKIAGLGEKFVGEVFVDRTISVGGMNHPISDMFGNSLANSCSSALGRLNSELRKEFGDEAIRSLERKMAHGDFSLVHADVYHKLQGKKSQDFCRITTEEAQGRPRTLNALPKAARVVYSWAWLLRKLNPPKGYEALRRVNLIKGFKDPLDGINKFILVKDEATGKYEVADVPKGNLCT